MFVINGDLTDDHGDYVTGSWIRYPHASRHAVHSESGCTLYVKSGHLPPN
ncbi:MAG: cupin domain-containing protein [Pseudomonadota bacterium]|nr:cupin domain-containing protein [Pseudomonadota bacterium]